MACVDSTVLTGFKHTPVMHGQYMLSFVGAQSCDLLNALLDIWLVQQKSPGQRITCHALDMLEGLLDTVSPPQHASQPMHPLARALVEPDTKIQPNTRTSDLRQQLPARMIHSCTACLPDLHVRNLQPVKTCVSPATFAHARLFRTGIAAGTDGGSQVYG